MNKHVLLLTTLVLATFVFIIVLLTWQTNTPITLSSRAQEETAPQCPINTNLYVHELDEQGNEIPLNLNTYPDMQATDWSISDGQNEDSLPIYFNELPIVSYTLNSNILTFAPFPQKNDIYTKGDIAFIKLNYPADRFHIVKKEILNCSSPRNDRLCNTNIRDDVDELDVMRDVRLDCSMDFEAGWVVQKNITTMEQSATTDTVECDLSGDGACNTFDLFIIIDDYGKIEPPTLKGDINNDDRVNALDYTLITSQISRL